MSKSFHIDNHNNIKAAFKELNMIVNNIENTHPNGHYVTETEPITDNVMWTSGYLPSLETQLNKHDLYIHVWVVYPDHVSFIIQTSPMER